MRRFGRVTVKWRGCVHTGAREGVTILVVPEFVQLPERAAIHATSILGVYSYMIPYLCLSTTSGLLWGLG